MNTIAVEFGKNVRRVRKGKNISQEELAHLAGIDRSYMSRIERGIVSITLEKAFILARTLECDITQLLPSSGAQDHL